MIDKKPKKREIEPEMREWATLILEGGGIAHVIEKRDNKIMVAMEMDDLTRIVLEMNDQSSLLTSAREWLSRNETIVKLADNLDAENDRYTARFPSTQRMRDFTDKMKKKFTEQAQSKAAEGLADLFQSFGIEAKTDPKKMN